MWSAFFLVERSGAAERDRTDVAEYFPLPLRRLYCERRSSAIDRLACNETTVYKVEGQGLEIHDSRHVISHEASSLLIQLSQGRLGFNFSNELGCKMGEQALNDAQELHEFLLAQCVDFVVQQFDFKFCLYIYSIIVTGVPAIDLRLPVLTHHDDGCRVCRLER